MQEAIISLVLFLVALGFVSLQKTYFSASAKEIKRRAKKGDDFAKLLYKVVAYGISARLFLWLAVGVSGGAFFVYVSRAFPWPIALLGVVAVLLLDFAWLPNSRITSLSRAIAKVVSGIIAWILNYLHRPLESLGLGVGKFSPAAQHTKIYEKQDLIELLENQSKQTDNRITAEEIAMATNALSFGDRLVREVFVPRSQVRTVNINEPIGPVLMDELHKSGHSRFPVYQNEPSNIVGILYMHDLAKVDSSKKTKDLYHRQVFYIHEEQTLQEALQAFLKTRHHLFIVVNNFEEVLGVLTIEDVLEQIVGQPIIDEFDKYEDLRAVAQCEAEKLHASQNHEATEVLPTTEKVKTE